MKRMILLIAILAVMVSCNEKEHESIVTFEQEEVEIQVGKTIYTYLLDGNGGYSWAFSEEGIAEVIAVQYGTVRIKGIAVGQTVLTLTDRLGSSDTLVINITEAI